MQAYGRLSPIEQDVQVIAEPERSFIKFEVNRAVLARGMDPDLVSRLLKKAQLAVIPGPARSEGTRNP